MKRLCAVLYIGLLAQPLAAQARVDRDALDAFRDTLYQIGNADSLQSLELSKQARNADKSREDFLRLRRGFLMLRFADVTAEFGYIQSASDEFADVLDHHADWPYAWFGHGLAELGQVEGQFGAVLATQRFFGGDPLKRAKSELARSAETDSTFAPQLAPFILASTRQRGGYRLEVSLAVARKTAAIPAGRQPALLLARGAIERAAGELDSARNAIAAYRRLRPDDPMGMLEEATVMLEGGRMEGVALWYRGLSAADALTLALYRDDIALLMPDSTMRAFDAAASPVAREAVVRHFWTNSQGDGIPAGDERLRDHYIRLGYARGHYIPESHADLIEPLPRLTSAVDDRGDVYIRHGEPDVHTYVDLPGVPSNETWWYNGRMGDTLLFNFVVRPPYSGYRLVPSLFDAMAMSGQAKIAGRYQKELSAADSARPAFSLYGAGLMAQTAQELLAYRYDIPLYARMMSEGMKAAPALQAEERKLGDRSIADAETWELKYELALDAKVDLVAIGRDRDGTQLQVAFAVPSFNIIPTRVSRGYMYPVRMRAAALAPDGRVIAQVDTTRLFYSAQAIEPTSQLLGRLPLHLPPGAYSVRVVIESGVGGTITPREHVEVAAMDGARLTLSDLAIGTPSVRLSLPGLGGETAWINPLHSYPRKGSLSLYAEVGGLAKGTLYHTDIEVVRVGSNGELRGKGSQALKLTVDGKKSAQVDALSREIALSRLSPGDYAIVVTVSTASGERATRQQRFSVVKQ